MSKFLPQGSQRKSRSAQRQKNFFDIPF